MHTSQTSSAGRNAGTLADHARGDPAWFLRGCAWGDAVWIFEPTNTLEEVRPVHVRWDFALQNGRRFTDERYAPLLQTSRQLIALIRCRSLCSGLPLRASTVAHHFLSLRLLLRWMDQEGFTRFADLDATALSQFQHSLTERRGFARPTLVAATLQRHLYLLTCLYRFRDELDDALQIDPFPGHSHREAAGVREAQRQPWPHTPDAVAVALVQGAIDLVSNDAPHILRAREVYAEAMAAASERGCVAHACTSAATRALKRKSAELPVAAQPIRSVREFALEIDMLYAACFVVISYLVGPRVSEILHLQAGCVQQRGNSSAEDAITVIVGAIFKHQADYHGLPHEWVAPPPAVQAISILEALSAGHRAQAGRDELWLHRRRGNGATQWQHRCSGELHIPSAAWMNALLRRFAAWLGLPDHQGKAWRLTTHQGRKTFARFVALRDGSSLFALAQHLGHRERAMTDHGYAGSDYRLTRKIESARPRLRRVHAKASGPVRTRPAGRSPKARRKAGEPVAGNYQTIGAEPRRAAAESGLAQAAPASSRV